MPKYNLFITFVLAVIATSQLMAEDVVPCEQYDLVVCPHIDSTITYFFGGELKNQQPHVDSIWITGTKEDSTTIYLISYAQPNEKIDLSFLTRNHYLCFAQIGDCVVGQMFGFRGRTPTDTGRSNVSADDIPAQKVIINGQIFIRKNDIYYNIFGSPCAAYTML